MSNCSFRLTPRMINEEALRLLSQYAARAITLEVAMDEIKYILQSNFDEEEWMAITHCVLMDPLCFADVEAEFLERLAERGSSIATGSLFLDLLNPAGPSLKDPSILGMPDSAAEDHDNEVGSLLKDPAAWRIMMDWAQDKIEYPNFDNKIRGFGARYIHAEWQPLINAIFALSDPSNEDLQPPSSLVEGAMRAHGVSFATPPGSLPTVPTSPRNPSQSATRRPSGKTPRKSKCRKTGIGMFLDVATEEDDEDDDEDEDFSKAQKSAGRLVDVGPSGKSSFSQAIDSMMARYDGVPQYRGTRVQRLPEGVPLPSMKNVYIVDLFSESAQSFVYEYMKSKGVDVTFLPWLPRRLHVAGTCPAEVRNHLPPSHRHATKGIILLPPMEATSLSTFKAQQREVPILYFGENSIRSKSVRGNSVAAEVVSSTSNGTSELQVYYSAVLRDGKGISELRRVFSAGDTVRVIAGPYCGHVGHVITAYDGIVSLQYDGQSPNLEVSDLLLETHTPDHVRSLTTNHHTDIRMRLPETADSVLPGDIAVVCQGTYKGAEAPIEWMDTDGTQAWIYVKENQDTSSAPANTGSTSTQPDQQLGYVIVPINIHDIRVHRAARTIAFSKEKGFDICVGDDIEVARDKCSNHLLPVRLQSVLACSYRGLGWYLMGQFSPSAQFRSCNVDQLSPVICSTTPPPSIPPPLEEDPSVTTSDTWTVTVEDLSPAPDYGMSAIFRHLLFPN
ncbi:hypothetical protein EV401DRAFT_1895427 [Pisolithus croceorrhizus]|nr:hypothetical protein EV401DRAFT_1895427 [Pisolithus croceorrhizus]